LNHAVRNGNIYIIQKSDNRIIVGATVEDIGFDTSITAGAVLDMLKDAWRALPGIYELVIGSIDTGFRPGVQDNQPILGKTDIPGLYLAVGHYRSGVLLTPITAYNMAKMISNEEYQNIFDLFSHERFKTKVS
jgi:glycine oxidase